jgi:DNA-binding HxlR family transcriptional regulator
MRRASFEDMNCSVARSLEVIGEWWTLLILRDAFLGVTRFDEFQDRLGVARNVLAARLDTLVTAGVLDRRVYDEARGRADYELTEKGRALWPVLVAIRQWGDDWVVGRDLAPVETVHRSCGAVMRAEPVCTNCGERLEAGAVVPVPGPGLRDERLLAHVRRRGAPAGLEADAEA